jgi:hypothetical protein
MAAQLPPINLPVHPNHVQFNQYLENTLGIHNPDLRQAINQQGCFSFDSFIGLSESDLTTMASNIRKPGGTMVGQVQAVGRPRPNVPNPGIAIGFLEVRRLEFLRFYVHHCTRIQRPLIPDEMTIERLQRVYQLKETEDLLKKDTKTPELPGKIVKIDDVRNNIEDLDDYLLEKRGESGLPLAYVVRDTVALPLVDPGFGQPTSIAEMIARGDHTQPAFETDTIAVFNIIRHMTHGGLAWSWVSAYNRTKNGRDAYIAFKSHYLGESYQARIKAAADSVLTKTYFDGQRSFTFEQYTSVLQKAFTDMESTGEEVAEERKIRILLNGITSSSLQTAVGIVRSTPTLKTNYELAVNYLSETNDGMKLAATSKRNVSAVASAAKTKHSKKATNYKAKSKNKYYKPAEWWALTDAQRAEIRRNRPTAATTAQTIQTVVTGVPTDVSAVAAPTQSVGAVMTRRHTPS